ncbi:MAG: serine/threonine protein kinase [candidate division Zixibacteria bacterium]|nr:serine/threonine protein kinase [candidate division Zixibacteria bacterium]
MPTPNQPEEKSAEQSPYRLVELVGSGGMANVYRAIQVSLEREVAIKRLHPYLIQNLSFLARFQKEARAAASLRHENLVSVIDYGQDAEGYFIVMEYVRGRTLREILEQGKVPLEAAIVIAHKVALGLGFCHSSGVVHRDVKPGNILLSEDGEVKLTDFGIAKAQDASITVTGTTLGSPAYMAPEQLRSMEVDRRADVFSLGVVLYEMLSGKKPFDGDNYSAVITSILTAGAVPLCDLSPEIPARLSLLAAQMLEKDPDRRVSKMEEAAERLEGLMHYYGVSQRRELLRNFLASPDKFSREAQSQRVKRHLDSGIYYFHLGRGKIAEAKREFREALRWDSENPVAQEYLERLSAEPTESMDVTAALEQEALNRRLFPYGLVLLFVLGIFLYFGFEVLQTATRQFQVEKQLVEKEKRLAVLNAARRARSPEAGEEDSDEEAFSPQPVPGSWVQVGVIPTGEEAYLVVSAKRRAYVRIDGKLFGKVPPPRAFKVAGGKHTVVYTYPGYKARTKNVRLNPGDSKLVDVELRQESRK